MCLLIAFQLSQTKKIKAVVKARWVLPLQWLAGLCSLLPHSSLITVVADSIPYMGTDHTACGHESTHRTPHVVVKELLLSLNITKC